ncbi:hypothetical protein ACJ2A9_17545 [Anaerobacillus sp. MEB173]|uniref:hypothetical protein n=1 Tax=Anaerobacillus sp. MEB173 TaxID=3383345 RepID=UPI003F937B0E
MEKRIFLLIPGCLLLGMGIGLAYGDPAPGMFIGLGLSFILIAIHSLLKGSKAKNQDKNTDV